MSIPKFVTFTSGAVPVEVENIDTDQIIPARFLKATERKGFGDNLFRDWRYDAAKSRCDVPAERPALCGEILVAGRNFGCGSSREHAAWALRTTASGSWFRVFCGHLPQQCAEQRPAAGPCRGAVPAGIFDEIRRDPRRFTVDLDNQRFTIVSSGASAPFEIDAYKKRCLQNGYDDVDYLRSISAEIAAFEKNRS